MPRPLNFRPRVWFNADLESRNYIIPGLIAVIMMVIAALLTSLTVAREWERGTMEQLISTPVKGPELILGKLIPYFAIGMFDVLLAVLMGEFLFHVPLRGSGVLLFGHGGDVPGRGAVDGHAHQHRHQEPAAGQPGGHGGHVPAGVSAVGFCIPIANMPRLIQMITYIVPAGYFVALLKGIYLKGVGWRSCRKAFLWPCLRAIMVLLANVKFRKKLVLAMFERIKHMLIKEFIQVFRDPRMRSGDLRHSLRPGARDRLRGEPPTCKHVRHRRSTIWTTATPAAS